MNIFVKFLLSYGYNSPRELFESMFPTWKYHLQTLSLILSAISGGLSYLFGFGPVLGVAMLIAVLVEVVTGIIASRKLGSKFESFRFSRCILKLGLWALLFFIIHQFENEYESKTHILDIAAYIFFKIVFLGTITMFLVEYATSILENMAVIDGKPKTHLIEVIQSSWKELTNIFKKEQNG